jgi:hypothetical protein
MLDKMLYDHATWKHRRVKRPPGKKTLGVLDPRESQNVQYSVLAFL